MNQPISHDLRDLYQRHHGWLKGWLLRKLGCHFSAEDFSHDTFLRLLSAQQAPSLREPRAYLLVVASRLLINAQRRRQVEQDALRQVALLLETCERRGPEQVLAAHDLLAQVLTMLTEELPEKQQKAFVMARVDGLSYSAIASKLEVSESSVKQYLSKTLVYCHTRLFDSLN